MKCELFFASVSTLLQLTNVCKYHATPEWRHLLLHEFLVPLELLPPSLQRSLPASYDSTLACFSRADVQRRLEATLEHAFATLQQQVYEPLLPHVWREVVRAVEFVLLDGFACRSLGAEQAGAVQGNLDALRVYFSQEFTPADVHTLSGVFDEVCALMAMPTEKLIAMWQSLGAGAEAAALRMRLTRVLWQRGRDKGARKFVKRLVALDAT